MWKNSNSDHQTVATESSMYAFPLIFLVFPLSFISFPLIFIPFIHFQLFQLIYFSFFEMTLIKVYSISSRHGVWIKELKQYRTSSNGNRAIYTLQTLQLMEIKVLNDPASSCYGLTEKLMGGANVGNTVEHALIRPSLSVCALYLEAVD